MRRLLLASGSPRRREMLRVLGLPFEVARPDIDETSHSDEPADRYVARLSLEKSATVSDSDAIIITADTTVAQGADILGKPANAAEATAMLERLRGLPHVVHTGTTVRDAYSGEAYTSVLTTQIIMRPYTDDEIRAYVESGEPYDKAGGYAIQDPEFHPVERIDGCYGNVMGLPICTLCKTLAALGVKVPAPVNCTPDGGRCAFEK